MKFAIVLFACLASSVMAGSLRCNQALIDVGDSMRRVEQYCGEPTEAQQYTMPLTYIDARGYRRNGGEQVYTEWIYNFGPNRFMAKVRFIAGDVTQIHELGYGY
ncbi:DUF2845 domain-containing protein [Deefgea salmonis]|uniref:DUF2845 domain-containing protein n=1 Tax=Deefgea salmonis TaxID=2875502 RepID=A0ABS8BMX0_9NEIS|nr:DUF2845 domain-containing protein [Deefgea salmonis]MCB5196957.1 DUF2845 domain-containing protein [Deefgea salmonis]